MLFKLRRYLIVTLACLVIALALSQAMLRLLLPMAHEQKDRLALELGRFLNAQVSIERLDSHWKWFVPYIDAQGVRIQQEGVTRHELNRLSVGLNLFSMVRSGSWLPNHLKLDGVHVTVIHTKEKGYQLAGVDLPTSSEKTSPIDLESLLSHKRIQILDAGVTLIQQSVSTDFQIRSIELDLQARDDRYRGTLAWAVPEDVGAPARIEFDVTGNIRQPHTWEGHWDLDLPPQNFQAVGRYFPALSRYVKEGHIALQSHIQLNHGQVQVTPGKENLLDFVINTPDEHTLVWQSALNWQADKANALVLDAPLTVDGAEVLKGVSALHQEETGWTLGVEHVSLNTVPDWIASFVNIPAPWDQRLPQFNPDITVRNTTVQYNPKTAFHVRAQVDVASVESVASLPGLRNLNAQLSYDATGLKIDVDQADVVYDHQPLFRDVLTLDRLRASVHLDAGDATTAITVSDLYVHNADVTASGGTTLRFEKGKRPHLDLDVEVARLDIGVADRYTPAGVTPDTVLEWLDRGLQGGELTQGKVMARGHFGAIFKKDKGGEFTVDALINDGVLNYGKGWPLVEGLKGRFSMDGLSLSVDATAGRTVGIDVASAKAHIPTLSKTELFLTLKARESEFDDLLGFLRESEFLREKIGVVPDLFNAKGKADLDFELQMQISKKFPKPKQQWFTGVITLSEGQLHMPLLDLDVGGMNGQITFTQNSLTIPDMPITLNQRPVTLAGTTIGQDRAVRGKVSLTGQYQLKDILKENITFITDRFQGDSQWNTHIEFPFFPGQPAPSLVTHTDLKGVTVSLPAPLGKAKQDAGFAQASMEFSKTKSDQLQVQYGDQLQSILVITKAGLERGAVYYDYGAPILGEDEGLVINAKVDTVSVDDWLDYITESSSNASGETSDDTPVRQIYVEADHAHYGGQRADNIKASIEPLWSQDNSTVRGWDVAIDSPEIHGGIQFYSDDATPMRVHLGYFDLNGLHTINEDESDNVPTLRPSEMVEADIIIDDFKWDDMRLKGLSGLLRRGEGEQVLLQELSIQDEFLTLTGTGQWELNDQQHMSHVNFSMQMSDFGRSAEALGFGKLASKGKGGLNANVKWEGAPWQFNLLTLKGESAMELNNGEFLDVEPGAVGRFIGVLSLQALPRKLALDFDNVTSSGLAYERIKGQARIDQGVMYFDNVAVKADFGKVKLQGYTDLVRREVNQIATVTPDIGNGVLPVAAAIAGGVPWLIGSVVVDRVVDLFGGNTDEIVQIRYHVTGPWDSPNTERTRIKRIGDLSEDELEQRAMQLVIENAGNVSIVDENATYPDIQPLELSDEEEAALFGE